MSFHGVNFGLSAVSESAQPCQLFQGLHSTTNTHKQQRKAKQHCNKTFKYSLRVENKVEKAQLKYILPIHTFYGRRYIYRSQNIVCFTSTSMNANSALYHKISAGGLKKFAMENPVPAKKDTSLPELPPLPRHIDATQPHFIEELDAKLFELAQDPGMSSETIFSTSVGSMSSQTSQSSRSDAGMSLYVKKRVHDAVNVDSANISDVNSVNVHNVSVSASSASASASALETAIESALGSNAVRRVSRKASDQLNNLSIQKRKSHYTLDRPKKHKVIRQIQSKLDLIDNSRLTHFPSMSIDSDRLSIVEDYIPPPTHPSDHEMDDLGDLHYVTHCFGCQKQLPAEFFVLANGCSLSTTLRYLCGQCIDSRDPMFRTFSRVLKIEMQESVERPGETYYVLEESSQGWLAALMRRFRWRWRLKGLLTDLRD